MDHDVEGEAGAQDVRAQQAVLSRLLQSATVRFSTAMGYSWRT